jgi:DNA-binding FrmR family transcriptional regulator
VDPVVRNVTDMIENAQRSCNSVLTEIDRVRADLQSARKVQETVYNSFSKVITTNRPCKSFVNYVLGCL